MNMYDVGDKIRISASFVASGIAADPTVVELNIYISGILITKYTYGLSVELIKDSTGHYHLDYTITVKGNYAYEFTGSGAVVAADINFFIASGI